MILIRYCAWAVFRFMAFLRYRVRVHNKQALRELKGPVLVLPNHPAYVDPPIVMALLWPLLKPRPLVYEANYRDPVLWPMMKLMNALEVPDLERASVSARAQAEKVVHHVVEGLKEGHCFALWPSGHLQHDGVERLGGARSASQILQEVENLTVVLVRTRGLWGSTMSQAFTGTKPSLAKRALQGIGWVLANLILFMPRRKVELHTKIVRREEIPNLERDKLNRWLEEWYNVDAPEEPTWKRYHFLSPRFDYEFPPIQKGEDLDLSEIKPETKEVIAELLKEKIDRDLTEEERDNPELGLDELGLDSLDRMDVTLEVQNRFGFNAAESPLTVGGLWALAEGVSESDEPPSVSDLWRKPPSTEKAGIEASTLLEAFLDQAFEHPKDVVLADDLSGALSYEKMLVGGLLMAKRFKKIEGDKVGLMLPASVACDVAFLGLHLAGKLPVLLNWTTGPGNLAHAAKAMKLTKVITSKAFIDRTGVEVEGPEYLFMEELRKEIGLMEKVTGLLRTRWFRGGIRARLPEVSPSDPAVVLFTSGSEKAPKAVPLTHENLLTDQRLCIETFELTREDSVMAILPSFHSFGLSVTGWLPILGGLRAVRHPDPTDAGAIVRKIEAYQTTLVAGTPTFIRHILNRSRKGQLDSVTMFVLGAEKCPDSLFERCAELAPNAKVIEGYGITECSPVITANPRHAPRKGSIGKPLPGVKVKVVDPDSGEEMPTGEMGMILVSGPTVFPGYLDYDGPSPFREEDGTRWYETGDLGELDSEGYLWFRGRMKRFLKAGGEMISLPALEEPFALKYPPDEDGPRVAVEGVETDEGRRIVLFTRENIGLREANEMLSAKGMRGVMRLDAVEKVDSLPTLGTGKTDYKVLRARIEEGLKKKEPAKASAAGE